MMDAGMFQVLLTCCTCIMSTNQGTPMLPPMTAASMKIIVLSKYKYIYVSIQKTLFPEAALIKQQNASNPFCSP